GLTGIRFSHDAAKGPIRLKADAPIKLLVGYFAEDRQIWAKPPDPEIDADAARTGGAGPVIRNAVQVEGCPAVNVHVFTLGPGQITFDPHSPGSYLILGVIPADAQITPRDAGIRPGRK
ncbi:MAG: hypothetical protein QHH07_04570, partial [Sedimentisphaerales bacterium]|nr:hypothetical protein [Sedimentisphaerales bacterium]